MSRGPGLAFPPGALALCLTICLAVAAPAWAGPPDVGIRVDEDELTRRIKSGRLGQDELVAKGDNLSYFEKLKLYYYAQELTPFFEVLEERLRDLARTDPTDGAAMDRAKAAVTAEMKAARARLLTSGREEPELEWRRGLVGLIFLDRQWRWRVWNQGKREIRNPYDLVALLDCLDAWLAGNQPCGPYCCRHWAPAEAP